MSSQSQSGLPPSSATPAIRISAHDVARLEAMLDAPALRGNAAAAALQRELDRADVLPPGEVPADVVGMHSTVECVDEHDGAAHALTLVYPHEADVDTGRVSVLAPVGSALLGLSVGQQIDWPASGGRTLRLRVTAVTPAAT
ncbi:nucleoside diphosphate kinase regulator [Luteimonas sp. BDR2-5]|uniref:nucleoside diphosphate kinase regulator n=1 Tax=Proluteimonas luteida TaxID=2878685 RepID=UPI001E34FE78|nr:nucleoside diphosphate kinase regulator [Luteimonas sp. BDR2-5]MCD9028927.1 nucleoside diphosphate kinase regulator [Luteimonas sp. BDR2-5]